MRAAMHLRTIANASTSFHRGEVFADRKRKHFKDLWIGATSALMFMTFQKRPN
jgi:hypothetical protein